MSFHSSRTGTGVVGTTLVVAFPSLFASGICVHCDMLINIALFFLPTLHKKQAQKTHIRLEQQTKAESGVLLYTKAQHKNLCEENFVRRVADLSEDNAASSYVPRCVFLLRK